MTMREILYSKLKSIYIDSHAEHIDLVSSVLTSEIRDIVDTFYSELLLIPETRGILQNSIVEKNLRYSLENWIIALFSSHSKKQIEDLIKRQIKIGSIHANNQVSMNFFSHGISILKREIYSRIREKTPDQALFSELFLVVGELFDVLISIISESYFSNERIHENNEMALKIKGMSQNTAVEWERLRSMLFDWLRNTLPQLYQSPGTRPADIVTLRHSNFGLWVIYKADFLSNSSNVTANLETHIREIDAALLRASESILEGRDGLFSSQARELNDAVTKCSWYISTVVDEILQMDSVTDPLTHLYNRRYLETILRRQTEMTIRYGLPYSLLMIDIDHFKQTNDTYGHDSGDVVLKQFAEILLDSVRTSDFIFRYGGEEFLIILGNVDRDKALIIAEKIRRKCEENSFLLPDGKPINKTCSIGIAVHDGHPDYGRIIKKSDSALYKAKETGRNRVVVAE